MSILGFCMNDDMVRVAVGLFQPHHCHQCGTEVNHLGLHGLSCRMSQGQHSWHAAVNKLIRRALALAKVPSHLEPSGTSCANGKRADGAMVIPWKCGQALIWDATGQILMPLHIWPLAAREASVYHCMPFRSQTVAEYIPYYDVIH